MQTAFGNSSATVFQIHFAPSPTTTCRCAAANPNRCAARHSRCANGDGCGSASFDRALSIAAVCRAEPASRSGRPVLGFRAAVWNTATFASRVFAGWPSSPAPASRRTIGTPVPSGLQYIVSAGASASPGDASSSRTPRTTARTTPRPRSCC